MAKEEQTAPALFRRSLHPHITPPARTRTAELRHVNRLGRRWRKPLVDQKPQRLFARGSHDLLRNSLSRCASRVDWGLSSSRVVSPFSAASAAASAIIRLVAAARNDLQWAACRRSERRRTSCRADLRFIHPPHCTRNLTKHFNSMPDCSLGKWIWRNSNSCACNKNARNLRTALSMCAFGGRNSVRWRALRIARSIGTGDRKCRLEAVVIHSDL